MDVNIIIDSNKISLLFVWSTLKKEKKRKKTRCVKIREFTVFCVYLMHYWISLALNTNPVSHIRGVGVNLALLRCIGIASSTDKRHFLVINLAS